MAHDDRLYSPTAPVRPLSAIARDINRLLVEAKNADDDKMEQVRQIGVLLYEVKDRLEHGEFGALGEGERRQPVHGEAPIG